MQDNADAHAITFLALPPELIARIAALLAPEQQLLGLCKVSRNACLANVSGAELTRGYEGAVDDVHVATLARCPRLTRLDAAALHAQPWPLAAVTRLASLTVHARANWRAATIPTSLCDLDIAGRFDTKNLLELQSRTCVIHVHEVLCLPGALEELAEPWMARRLRIRSLWLCDRAPAPALGPLAASVLVELTSLQFQFCKVTSVQCLSSLRNLNQLHFEECSALARIDALPSALASLSIRECHELAAVQLGSGLTSLCIDECIALTALEFATASRPQLQVLEVTLCRGLDAAGAATWLPTLRRLDVVCRSSGQIDALRACVVLTYLVLKCEDCVPSRGSLRPLGALRNLWVCGSRELEHFGDFGADIPPQLTTLTVSACSRVKSLAGLSHVSALQRLELAYCDELCTLEGLASSSLPHVTCLEINGCDALASLAGLPLMPQLARLELQRCASFVGDLPPMSAATRLWLMHLPGLSLNKWPLSTVASSLQQLFLEGLDDIRLTSLGALEHLCILCVRQLPCVLDLTGLEPSAVPQLAVLQLQDMRLTSLRGLGDAHRLEELSVTNCGALSTLDGLSGCTRLKTLRLERCRALTSLQGLASRVRAQPDAIVVVQCDALEM